MEENRLIRNKERMEHNRLVREGICAKTSEADHMFYYNQVNRYKIRCDVCDKELWSCSWGGHQRSQRHKRNLQK